MALKVGDTTVKKVKVVKDGATTDLKELYVGDILVWKSETVVASAFSSGTAQNWANCNTSKSSSTFTCDVGDVITFTCVQHLQADNAGFTAEYNLGIGGGYTIYKDNVKVETEERDVQFNATQSYKDQTWNVSYTVTSAGAYRVVLYAFVGEKTDLNIYASSYTKITSDIIVS